MRDIVETTAAFEQWIAGQTRWIEADLASKHCKMADDAVAFLRATYYRWAELLPVVCEAAAAAPAVWSVGDLHIENFGLWRDAEGRSVWGVNDFDECDRLPYLNDLLRLAVSAHLTATQLGGKIELDEICDSLLDGYAAKLKDGGSPIVLGAADRWLRELLPENILKPNKFWRKLHEAEKVHTSEKSIRAAAEAALPAGAVERGVGHRVAGLGSLGRARVVAWGTWSGGPVAREAKQLVLPASVFAETSPTNDVNYATLIKKAVRAADPFTVVTESNGGGAVVVRRLAPESGKIDVTSIVEVDQQRNLLHLMGCETANVHLADRKPIAAVQKHLTKLKRARFAADVERMTEQALTDWKRWRKALRKR